MEARNLKTNMGELSDGANPQSLCAVITMGCGDACPIFPGKRYEDWVLEDPAGQDLEFVRKVRDDIKARVETLLSELLPSN